MKRLFVLMGLFVMVGCGQDVEVGVGVQTTVADPVSEVTLVSSTEQIISPTSEPTSEPVVQSTEAATFEPTGEPTEESVEESTAMSTNSANANVTFVKATETSANVWTFAVSVDHPDTGWEDYADGWDVFLPDGTVLKLGEDSPFTRLLLHPHVGERPFTRSQSNLQIPANITQVHVRAHDLVDGFGGQEIIVDLTATSTEFYEVVRLP